MGRCPQLPICVIGRPTGRREREGKKINPGSRIMEKEERGAI